MEILLTILYSLEYLKRSVWNCVNIGISSMEALHWTINWLNNVRQKMWGTHIPSFAVNLPKTKHSFHACSGEIIYKLNTFAAD